jgi:hypothetical protein
MIYLIQESGAQRRTLNSGKSSWGHEMPPGVQLFKEPAQLHFAALCYASHALLKVSRYLNVVERPRFDSR